jgi:membrane-associated protease RseP (regulator of RpoE activity)
MPASLYLLGVIVVMAGIGLSIALHEIGHLVPAKRFGVKVTQYMVGFGPTIWSRRRGETEYGIKAIPLGGYIRMIGMFPPGKDSDESVLRASSTGRFSLMVDDARRSSLEEVTLEDRDRVFWKLPVRKRLVIMLGGPMMNLLISILLFTVTLVGFGVATAKTTVDIVLPCMPTSANPNGIASADGRCVGSEPSAAAAMGLQSGDTVIAVNGTPTLVWTDLTSSIRASGGRDVEVTIQRGSQQITTSVLVPFIEVDVLNERGLPTGETTRRGFLGVGPQIAYERQPLASVPSTMWSITERSAWAVMTLPVRVYELAVDTVTGAGRSLDSPVSVVGVADIGGDVAAASSEPLRGRIAFIISMLAGLNLFLFLFNLLPMLPLDGGHVAGALWEGARRGVARLRGRPDPGPVDVAKALPVAYAVTLALLLVASVVIIADVINPISL